MQFQPILTRILLPTLCLVAELAQAGYNTCGSALYPSSTRTCPDGSLAVYHAGEPVSFSAASLDFGNVLVGSASTAKSITISNTSDYSLTLPSTITLSEAFYRGSTTNCGSALASGSSCTLNVVFTPATTGTASGKALVTTNLVTYSVTLSGTGIVTTTSGSSTTSTTSTTSATHSTKPAPTSCTSYLGGSTLTVPYLSVGGTPMWAELQSTGSILNYKVIDYGPLSGSASCAADGATLTGLESLSLAKLYYNGSYYTATLHYAGTATDGSLLFGVTGAAAYQSSSGNNTGSNAAGSNAGGNLDHSILIGNWALHYGVSTVTFRDDGTYDSPNGGTGTYSWSGDTLNIDGALTSGHPGTAIFEVTASATWMQISWPSSYGGTASMVYYKQN